jgi:hypothetical protein
MHKGSIASTMARKPQICTAQPTGERRMQISAAVENLDAPGTRSSGTDVISMLPSGKPTALRASQMVMQLVPGGTDRQTRKCALTR